VQDIAAPFKKEQKTGLSAFSTFENSALQDSQAGKANLSKANSFIEYLLVFPSRIGPNIALRLE
jgi:hypothetical protein